MVKKRLHSSRMHTARSLTVSPSMLCSGDGCLPCPGWGVPALSRVGGACLVLGGMPAWSGWGVPTWSAGGGIPACTGVDPPMNKITDACENITFPQIRCGQ